MTEQKLTPSQTDIIRALADRFPVDRIDCLWIFPPRFAQGRELGLIVLSLEPEGLPTAVQRSLITLRYETHLSGRRERREEWVTEEGRAPAAQIERVIAGVLSRSRFDEGEPILELVERSADRWSGLLERLCPVG